MNNGYPAWFLVGATATGKTAVAHHLAREMGFELLSADAYQVYRELSIGTAKPSLEERDGLRYHGLDCVSITDPFSAGHFLREAREAFEDCTRRGRRMLVVGGTGLYIRALLHGLDTTDAVDPKHRSQWRDRFADGGVEALREAIAHRAPDVLERMPDPRNPRRLLRVLERLDQGLDPLPTARQSGPSGTLLPPLPLLSCSPGVLAQRIDHRIQRMLAEGLLAEIRTAEARAQGRWSETARAAIGTTEMLAVLEGRLSVAEASRQMAVRTRQFAKRQRTWFRHQVPTIEIIAPDNAHDVARAARDVAEHWRLHGHHTVFAATAGARGTTA